jgi:hypothetical protein
VENGKQLHNLDIGTGVFRQPQTVFEHSCPVRNAVIAVPRQHVVFEDSFENERNVEFHDFYLLFSLSLQANLFHRIFSMLHFFQIRIIYNPGIAFSPSGPNFGTNDDRIAQ